MSPACPPLPHALLTTLLPFSLFRSTHDYLFQATISTCWTSPNPMNEYEHLDYDAPNEPSCLLMFTNDSDYFSPHFSPNNNRSTLSPFDHSSTSSNASGAEENNNTHFDNLRRSRPSSVVSNYLSPAIPSSPLLTFHPSYRLSVNFSQTGISHLFPKF